MRNLLFASTLAVGLSCIGTSFGISQTTQSSGWQFRCPLPGAVVELSGGGSITFRGKDASDSLICLTGNDSRRFLNYWFTDTDLVRNGRREIGSLFPATPGKEIIYQYATFDPRTHVSVTIRASWRIANTGSVQVPVGTFDAIKIEHARETVGGNWRHREALWLDRITGVPIKAEIDFAGGVALGGQRSWEATKVRMPSS